MNRDVFKLYAITDRSWLDGRAFVDVCRDVLRGGASMLQLREKGLDEQSFRDDAVQIKALCSEYGVPLIINDNVALAKEIGVGVHVGQGDTPLKEVRKTLGADAIVGVSCQTVAQAIEAERDGASYLGVGAVFPTSTKQGTKAVDYRLLNAICNAVSIPVVAIGGVSASNLMRLAGSGIAGVAVVSALFAAKEPYDAARELRGLVARMLDVPQVRMSGAIIDLDGLLLDSLSYWEHLAEDYLVNKGRTPQSNLRELLDSMEMEEGAEYMKKMYALDESVEQIVDDLVENISDVYISKASFFPGAADFLKSLHANGIHLALFSATKRELVEKVLERHGVLDLFDVIVSTMDIPYDKAQPEAFLYVLGQLGTELNKTVVYDDASYAISGAKKSGMRVFSKLPESYLPSVLTIAGSDTIGGAGVQADLKTMAAHGVYGMSVIAALTAQNTLGVQAIHTPPVDFIEQECDSVFSDIMPDAVKIGMLANAEVILAVARKLRQWNAKNIVLDTVMVSTSGHRLLEEAAEKTLVSTLLPMATIITPNLPEAAVLAQMPSISNKMEMQEAVRRIARLTPAAILVKGGHLTDCADDLLYLEGREYWFPTEHIDTPNTHGTGCTLSSAIASNIALGFDLVRAVKNAKEYITGALKHDPKLGHGNGPLNHAYLR